MGFTVSSNTINVIAKLTPLGRKSFLNNNSNLITHFTVGDDDANYNVSIPLDNMQTVDVSGNKQMNQLSTIGASNFYTNRNKIFFNNLGDFKKPIKDISVSSSIMFDSGNTLNMIDTPFIFLNVNDIEKNEYLNLTTTLSLPLTSSNRIAISGLTSIDGGFSDTSLSAVAKEKYVLFEIPSSAYGETIDAKTFNFNFYTTSGLIETYATYVNSDLTNGVLDSQTNDTFGQFKYFGDSIAFLFSDFINYPNSDNTKSWSTGYGMSRPFSNGLKEKFNLVNDSLNSIIADEPIGFVNLDKGFVVIFNESIVNDIESQINNTYLFGPFGYHLVGNSVQKVGINISIFSNGNMNFKSLSTNVSKSYTCILGVNEFFQSNNPTYINGDSVRISEICLLDSTSNVIAVAKLNKHLIKTSSDNFVITINLTA